MKELLKSLANAKSEIGKMSKDNNNPFFKSKFFDINQLLEHVEPLLFKHNLVVLQPILEGRVVTRIYHAESGDSISSELELPQISDPQKVGSAITYYRRYTLASLLAIQAEDDDGNKASQGAPTNNAPSPEKWLNITKKDGSYTPEWDNILKAIGNGVVKSVADVRKHYKVNKEVAVELEKIIQNG